VTKSDSVLDEIGVEPVAGGELAVIQLVGVSVAVEKVHMLARPVLVPVQDTECGAGHGVRELRDRVLALSRVAFREHDLWRRPADGTARAQGQSIRLSGGRRRATIRSRGLMHLCGRVSHGGFRGGAKILPNLK